ncbi:hypothetical protein [Polaromonas sp. AER18D-145]|uniref:hypothetical protein n=1 Tax=Polaromonas sp. AER18D-145 TaxID=1977060 RepID=UPI000BBCC385|nr:hypothetical protein [Polaromonas sp. AER18D-145]
MILETISEIQIVAVLERGVPNKEAIALKAIETIDTASFGLLLGMARDDGLAVPFHDHFFWLGGAILNPGDYIFVNTGDGEARINDSVDKLNKLYSVYWKKSSTLFADSRIVPVLIKMGSVHVFQKPMNRPQTKNLPLS